MERQRRQPGGWGDPLECRSRLSRCRGPGKLRAVEKSRREIDRKLGRFVLATLSVAALTSCALFGGDDSGGGGDEGGQPDEDPELSRFPSGRLPFPTYFDAFTEVGLKILRVFDDKTVAPLEMHTVDVATFTDRVVVIYRPADARYTLQAAVAGPDRDWTTTEIWTGSPSVVRVMADDESRQVYVAVGNDAGEAVQLIQFPVDSPSEASTEEVPLGTSLSRCPTIDIARSPTGQLDITNGTLVARRESDGGPWVVHKLRHESEPYPPNPGYGWNTGCRARLTHDNRGDPVVLASRTVVHYGNSDDSMVGKENGHVFYFMGGNGVFQTRSVWARQPWWDRYPAMTLVARHPDGWNFAGPARIRPNGGFDNRDLSWFEPFSPRGIFGRDEPGYEPGDIAAPIHPAPHCGLNQQCQYSVRMPEDAVGVAVNECGHIDALSITPRFADLDNRGHPARYRYGPISGSGARNCPSAATAPLVLRPGDAVPEVESYWVVVNRYDDPSSVALCISNEGVMAFCDGVATVADVMAGGPLLPPSEVPEIVEVRASDGTVIHDGDVIPAAQAAQWSSFEVKVAPWAGMMPVRIHLADVSQGDAHVFADQVANVETSVVSAEFTYPMRTGHLYRLAIEDSGEHPDGVSHPLVEIGRARSLTFRIEGEIFDHADLRDASPRSLDCGGILLPQPSAEPVYPTVAADGHCVVPLPTVTTLDDPMRIDFGWHPGAPFPSTPPTLRDDQGNEVPFGSAYDHFSGSIAVWTDGLVAGASYSLELPPIVDEWGVPMIASQRVITIEAYEPVP